MNRMSLLLPLLGTAALVAAITACSFAATTTGASAERGRYLVEKIGLCWDCHSPRDEQGQFVLDKWLQGAPLPFAPTIPMPWAPVSKPIAGLPGLSDEQALQFLTTGQLPDGRTPLPPMPSYRFSVEDARDVIAYLRQPIAPASPAGPAADPAAHR